MGDHRLLQRVQRLALGQILDRDEFRPVELPQQQNAGVHGVVAQPPGSRARQNDRTGAAVALGAALLRPPGASPFAQPVEHSRTRRKPFELNLAPPKPEAQGAPDLDRIVENHRRSSLLST